MNELSGLLPSEDRVIERTPDDMRRLADWIERHPHSPMQGIGEALVDLVLHDLDIITQVFGAVH